MENSNEIEMKGDSELATGRNAKCISQSQGFVCWLFLKM